MHILSNMLTVFYQTRISNQSIFCTQYKYAFAICMCVRVWTRYKEQMNNTLYIGSSDHQMICFTRTMSKTLKQTEYKVIEHWVYSLAVQFAYPIRIWFLWIFRYFLWFFSTCVDLISLESLHLLLANFNKLNVCTVQSIVFENKYCSIYSKKKLPVSCASNEFHWENSSAIGR